MPAVPAVPAVLPTLQTLVIMRGRFWSWLHGCELDWSVLQLAGCSRLRFPSTPTVARPLNWVGPQVVTFAILEGFRVKAYEKTGEVGGWVLFQNEVQHCACSNRQCCLLLLASIPAPVAVTHTHRHPPFPRCRLAWAPLLPLTPWACAATRPA